MSKDFLPECWQDDKRMNVLFSEFRAKDVNPQAWDGKMDFWRNVICSWCRAKNKVSFTESELRSDFERNGQYPQGLQTVINESLRLRDVVKTNDFGNLVDGNGWLSWGVNIFIKKPLVWSLSTLANTVNKRETPEQNYTLYAVLKEKADEVIKIHEKTVEFESTDHIINISTLWQQCQGILNSEADLESVLIYLKKERIVSTYSDESSSVVKFKRKNEKCVTEISEVDLGIVRLCKARNYMKLRIIKLQDDVEKCLQTAKQHLKQNEKAMAKSALRKKKMIERVIVKREISLENLDTLLQQIQDTESEKMVIDAYKSGVASFRSTLAEGGITIDNVDDTMASIQEVFDMHEDIQDTISQSIGGETDMSELESELEDLFASTDEPPEPPTIPRGGSMDDELRARLERLAVPDDVGLPHVPVNQFESEEKETLVTAN
uniref:Charged multivesicular body protein 7 n=1 Tax=Strigamia maritima TaxID=126957 RepID=T1J0Y3_STRMM